MRSAWVLILAVAASSSTGGFSEETATDGELVMVFISSSQGPANKDPDLAWSVRTAKVALRSKAEAAGIDFSAAGVAIDWDPREGWEYLINGQTEQDTRSGFGEWDEVHVGRNWRNEMVVKFVFRADREGLEQAVPIATVPQVLVIERSFETIRDGRFNRIVYGPDVTLVRLVGVQALRAWAGNGAPLKGSAFLDD